MGTPLRLKTTQEERKEMVIARDNQVKQSPTYNNKLQEFLSQPNTKKFNTTMLQKAFGGNLLNGGIKAFDSPEECLKEVEQYFALCRDCDMIPTISSLTLWLGCSRDRLYEIAKEKDNPQCDIIVNAIQACHYLNESGAISGNIPPNLFQFLSKNYYGLKDVSDINVQPVVQNQVDNTQTMKVIQEQIALEHKGE